MSFHFETDYRIFECQNLLGFAPPTDELTTQFSNLKPLFANGIVAWGHVIQANELMFEDGHHNRPGELVYSIENRGRVDPEYLQRVAGKLFRLKGTKPSEPKLRPIAHYLTDEMIGVFGLPVPHSISPATDCKISTTFFVRKHLPKRRLRATLLPTVVNTRRW